MAHRKKMVMDGDAPHLPQEIISNILKRLPVKSLIRFQCVCKDWKDLFKTPSFIEEHLRHSTQQSDFLLFKSKSCEGKPTGHLCMISRDIQVIEYQKVPSSVPSRFFVGSCNGLLCLRCLEFQSFILWNPATREILQVPQLPQYIGLYLVGFGFSPVVNDYKIVKLSLTIMGHDLKVAVVQVFSLSTGSWKEVAEAGKTKVINVNPRVCTGFTFDGAIYWFGCRLKSGLKMVHEFYLISFDMATESLTLIPVPGHVSYYSGLTIFDNKLAMLCDSGMYDNRIESTKPSSINLWVIEKCVDALGERWIWTNMYTHNYTRSACFSSLVTIWRNQLFWKPYASKGKVDIVENKLVSCNLHFNELKMLAIGKYPFGTGIWNYAESLVSLGNI